MKTINRFWLSLVMPISFAGMLSIGSAAELNPAAACTNYPTRLPGAR